MKPDEIGNYLKKLRLDKMLTQKELAQKLHVTHQAVSSWEKGKTLPDINTLSQLGDFYGVTIDKLLLKESSVEVAKEHKESLVLRRILASFGMLLSLICISTFFNYAFQIASHVTFTVGFLVLSIVYSFLLRQRKRIVEYALITSLLIIVTAIVFSSNARYYLLNETKFLQMTQKVEIFYPREFDEMTEAVLYNYIFDSYALIYTKSESDIDVFNLTDFHEGVYTTIDTGNMKIYDLVVIDDNLYFSTFNEQIPGEFKLYNLDFDTFEYHLIFESSEVLNIYLAFDQLFLVSNPFFESTTKIYQYNFENTTVSELISVDFRIYGMSEYFAGYDSYFILSVTNLDPAVHKNTIGLFDFDFELQHVLYVEEEAEVHHLFTGYGKTFIGTTNGAIYFKDLSYKVIGEGYARYPEVLNEEYVRINEKIYYENDDLDEFQSTSDVLFYDENFYPQVAKILIIDEFGDYYAIDNDFIGFVRYVPYEIEHVVFPNYVRVISLVIGIFTYGYFITLGHKNKK